MKYMSEKELRKVLDELYETLKDGGIPSVIYLPSVKHFSVTGKVGEQIVCVGLLLAQICNVTGRNVKEILDQDFYEYLLPMYMEILKEE